MKTWIKNKEVISSKLRNKIMCELEPLLLSRKIGDCANFWLDDGHNVFAYVEENGRGDFWIVADLELHESEEWIGDLSSYSTEDMKTESLEKIIEEIVNDYIHEF